MNVRRLLRDDLRRDFHIRRKTTRSREAIKLNGGDVVMMEVEAEPEDVSEALKDAEWKPVIEAGALTILSKEKAGLVARVMLVGAQDQGERITRIGPAPILVG